MNPVDFRRFISSVPHVCMWHTLYHQGLGCVYFTLRAICVLCPSRRLKARQHVNPLSASFQMPVEMPEGWFHHSFQNPSAPLHVDIGEFKCSIVQSSSWADFSFLGICPLLRIYPLLHWPTIRLPLTASNNATSTSYISPRTASVVNHVPASAAERYMHSILCDSTAAYNSQHSHAVGGFADCRL